MERVSRSLPEEALLGYHLCYGTFPEWPMREADDMELIVRMANTAVESTPRKVDYIHLAGPRPLRSDDDAFFAPLEKLEPGDAKIYLGLAMPHDGAAGLKVRMATAKRHLSDFGVANYCGFGRQPRESGQETLRRHRELVDAYGS